MELKEKFLTQKSKTSSYKYKVFIVIFLSLILIFLTSKLYLPTINSIDDTPIGTEKKIGATSSLTLKSWQYNKQNGLMEIVLSVKSTGNNFHQQFAMTAVSSGENSKLKAEKVYNSADVLVIDISDVKPNFSGIKLTLSLQNVYDSSEKNEADFICTNESVEKNPELEKKSESEFEQLYLSLEIENYQAKIEELKSKEEQINQHISELNIDIQALEKKLEFKTEDEKKEVYQAIESKNIEIKKLNNELYKNQSEQENYQEKISKCKLKIEEIDGEKS